MLHNGGMVRHMKKRASLVANLFQLTFAIPHIFKILKRAQSASILACDNLKFIAKLPNCVAITYSSTYPSNVDSLSNRDYKNII